MEVSDTRGERLPAPSTGLSADAETGRGLMLVAALAEEWGTTPREGAPGKTVWAVLGTELNRARQVTEMSAARA